MLYMQKFHIIVFASFISSQELLGLQLITNHNIFYEQLNERQLEQQLRIMILKLKKKMVKFLII